VVKITVIPAGVVPTGGFALEHQAEICGVAVLSRITVACLLCAAGIPHPCEAPCGQALYWVWLTTSPLALVTREVLPRWSPSMKYNVLFLRTPALACGASLLDRGSQARQYYIGAFPMVRLMNYATIKRKPIPLKE